MSDPSEWKDDGPAAKWLAKNFGNDLVQLQKDFQNTIYHPEAHEAFTKEMNTTFNEVITKAQQEGVPLKGIGFNDVASGAQEFVATRGGRVPAGQDLPVVVNASILAVNTMLFGRAFADTPQQSAPPPQVQNKAPAP